MLLCQLVHEKAKFHLRRVKKEKLLVVFLSIYFYDHVAIFFFYIIYLVHTGKMSTLEFCNSEVSNVKDQSFTS